MTKTSLVLNKQTLRRLDTGPLDPQAKKYTVYTCVNSCKMCNVTFA